MTKLIRIVILMISALSQEFKQVIVVRSDLKMGKGKMASQVAHAAVSAAEKAKINHSKWYNEWISSGQAKVTVKVDDLDAILDIKSKAELLGLITSLVEDRGLTQIPQGTVTCVAIGPGPTSKINKVTGKLKLL